MFLPKVESLILQRQSSKKTRQYSKRTKLLVIEVNVLSIFLNLGNNITFCNNVKDFYRTIKMFWTEHILSLFNLLCHTFLHFYIFQESTFCISSFSCWVRDYWKSTLKQESLTSVGMGLITACIHGVSHTVQHTCQKITFPLCYSF